MDHFKTALMTARDEIAGSGIKDESIIMGAISSGSLSAVWDALDTAVNSTADAVDFAVLSRAICHIETASFRTCSDIRILIYDSMDEDVGSDLPSWIKLLRATSALEEYNGKDIHALAAALRKAVPILEKLAPVLGGNKNLDRCLKEIKKTIATLSSTETKGMIES